MRRALAFLTPLGGAAVPDRSTLAWFPAVGALLGAAVGAVWWGSERLWPPLVAAGVTVVADLALTGLLHTDGLADSADGLLSQLPRARRLEVMADPAVGAYGVVAVVAVLVLRVATLAALAPDAWLLAALWCTSRTAMAVAARALPYARPGGLAADLLGGPVAPVAATGAVLALVLAALAGGGEPALGVLGAAAGAAVVVALGARRLGGFTGDVLGAAGVVGETVGLLVVVGAA